MRAAVLVGNLGERTAQRTRAGAGAHTQDACALRRRGDRQILDGGARRVRPLHRIVAATRQSAQPNRVDYRD